jgi:hypothetical protein
MAAFGPVPGQRQGRTVDRLSFTRASSISERHRRLERSDYFNISRNPVTPSRTPVTLATARIHATQGVFTDDFALGDCQTSITNFGDVALTSIHSYTYRRHFS